MDGMRGEEVVALPQQEGPLKDVLRLDLMGYIHQGSLWVNAEDDPLHNSYIGVGRAEVGG
jgi:hypothetical protein